MANEITARSSFSVRTNNIADNWSDNFQADMAGALGPTPGGVTVATTGTDVDLSALTAPGLIRLKNLEPVSSVTYVTWGKWDPTTSTFEPVGELNPGEGYTLRLSRDFLWTYGTGTGTPGGSTGNKKLRMYAVGGPCRVFVGAYER